MVWVFNHDIAVQSGEFQVERLVLGCLDRNTGLAHEEGCTTMFIIRWIGDNMDEAQDKITDTGFIVCGPTSSRNPTHNRTVGAVFQRDFGSRMMDDKFRDIYD
jgi:hypothetical protein